MATYTYEETVPQNEESWIEKLEHIKPTSLASAHYADIHFTKPKASEVSTLTHPHVTFERYNGRKNHWYVNNKKGKYVLTCGSQYPPAGQDKIAQEVLDDAVLLQWIRAALGKNEADEEGWINVGPQTQF